MEALIPTLFLTPTAVLMVSLVHAASSLLRLPVWTTPLLAILAMLATPRRPAPRERRPEPRWELPLRMAVTTTLVASLAVLSTVVDHRLAGTLAAFPVLVCMLTPLAHRRSGPGAATELVPGVLAGLLPSALIFLGLVPTHGLASGASLMKHSLAV